MTETTPAPLAETTPVIIAPPETLRCTRCGAQAYVEVQLLHSGSRVEFCGHHYVQHEAALLLQARRIIDYRPYLRSLEEKKPGGEPVKNRR